MDNFSLLFVDDEVEFLATVEEFFSDLGYPVFTACHGQEALLKVKEHRPKVVYLDISMPHMDGNETLQLIREIDPEVKVVIVSGYASESHARRLLNQGACDFFQKPVDLTQLLENVKRLRKWDLAK